MKVIKFTQILLSQAPRPSQGPHKLRESLPLVVFLRNRLKYALNAEDVKKIVKQRLIKIDGKVRTDTTYPAGFMGKQTKGHNIEFKICIDTIFIESISLKRCSKYEHTIVINYITDKRKLIICTIKS